MKIKIITHERVVFEGETDEVIATSKEGEFGILPNHVPCMKVLTTGVVRVKKDGKEERFAIMGGIFQFKDNEILILADTAESSNEINIERAKDALSRAENRLKEKSAEIDAKRAEAARARALVRLKASMENYHRE